MGAIPMKRQASPEDSFGIQATSIGSVSQDGKEWPVRVAIVEVMPELAQKLLDRIGKIQRNMKAMHLASLERDMLAGKFVFTGEPIIVSSAGNLIDGQHRLTLCVRTGKSFACLIVFGVPESSYRAINVTAKRTGADTLRISGYGQNSVVLSATATWVFRWQSENLLSNTVLSPTEVDEVVSGNRSLVDSVNKTAGVRPFGVGHALPAFCHFLFSRIDTDSADDFFGRFMTDVGHEEKSPILALRRKLLNPGAGGKTLTTRQAVISFFKAWNFYRQGKECKFITAAIDEPIPQLV